MKCSMGLWLLSLIIVLSIIAITVQHLMARVHISPRLAEELFRNFTKKYNKSYDTPLEYQKRLNIFTVSIISLLADSFLVNACSISHFSHFIEAIAGGHCQQKYAEKCDR